MVNVYIYIDNKKNARELVMDLVKNKLVAHASIDKDNNSFVLTEGEIAENHYYVITAQTRALLFNKIVSFVENKVKEAVKIYSMPITQCNLAFENFIKDNTENIKNERE